MRTFRWTIAYDGTHFNGWQVQPSQRTVQGELARVIHEITGETLIPAGAGRTDAGVHARGQVASVRSETHLPGRALRALANRHLPPDVRVLEVVEAPDDFHARHSARSRHYRYEVLARPDLLAERYAWYPRRCPPTEALDAATRVLEVFSDFTSFRAAGSAPGPPTCRVVRARWSATANGAAFDIEADRFLYHMVRNIVGTAFAVASQMDPASGMRCVLESRDRRAAGRTAPAHGLSLEHVGYAEEGE